MTEHGIDVAFPQGARFNWEAWRGRISFGMCKVSEGFRTDPDVSENWHGMFRLNPTMPRFGYHFFHASEDPVAQAEHFVATVKALGLLTGDNLVADFEATHDDGLNDHVPPWQFAERGRAFLHHVNALAPGHRILVYCNPAFAEAGNTSGMSAWHLWVANFGVMHPKVPAPWSTWTFWQNGDDPLDTDVFHGTHAQLLAFTRMPANRR